MVSSTVANLPAQQRPNVFVMVLDTVRADFVDVPAGRNFLERMLAQGSWFSDYWVAGNSTRISVNALFNGFYGATTGLNYHYQCDADFMASQTLSLADVFHYHGYQTLAVSQGDVYVPPWGFNTFLTFQHDFPLDALVDQLAQSHRPSFVYLHFSNLHDLAFGKPETMSAENYRYHLNVLSDELAGVWQRVVSDQDVVVIASDHGCNLRQRVESGWRFFREIEPTGGIFLGQPTVQGIGGLIGPRWFPACRVDGPVSAIDVFPTLLDALGMARPQVQGSSWWAQLQGAGSTVKVGDPERVRLAEAGGVQMHNGEAISQAIRYQDWKYDRYKTLGEAMYQLADDPGETRNLLILQPDIGNLLRSKLNNVLAECHQGTRPWYDATPSLCQGMLKTRIQPDQIEAGERKSCFQQLLDEATYAHIQEQVRQHVPAWVTDQKRIAVYSASEHAAAFLRALGESGKAIVAAVIDSNPQRAGTAFHGVPVLSSDALNGELGIDLIVVAHHFFANDMYARLRECCALPIPVVNMYDLGTRVPLWWDRIESYRANAQETS